MSMNLFTFIWQYHRVNQCHIYSKNSIQAVGNNQAHYINLLSYFFSSYEVLWYICRVWKHWRSTSKTRSLHVTMTSTCRWFFRPHVMGSKTLPSRWRSEDVSCHLVPSHQISSFSLRVEMLPRPLVQPMHCRIMKRWMNREAAMLKRTKWVCLVCMKSIVTRPGLDRNSSTRFIICIHIVLYLFFILIFWECWVASRM